MSEDSRVIKSTNIPAQHIYVLGEDTQVKTLLGLGYPAGGRLYVLLFAVSLELESSKLNTEERQRNIH